MGKDDLVERSESRATVVSDHNDGRHDEIGDMHLSARQKLNPQPTDDPNDPLNWPLWLKLVILVQASILAAIGGLNTASINPAYSELAKEFNISKVRASYQTTICIALNGVAPWIWIPLANKFGRRPIYLASTTLGFASALGCAYTKTFGQLLVARVFNGFFPAGFALAAATVTDLFFYHQRGRAVGFYTITMTTGSHLAPIIGGLLGQYCGWRWIFKFCAIVDGVLVVVTFFCLPETLYLRPRRQTSNSPGKAPEIAAHAPPFDKHIYLQKMSLYHPQRAIRLRPTQFILSSLKMAKYPSVLFPALYYATMYGFASILPAVTVASIFSKFFHWKTLTIGLTYGGSLTIGGILGECVSGWVVDLILRRAARRLGRDPEPEVRLKLVWAGNITVCTGLLMYGFCLQYHTPWPAPIVGMGLACFGLQIITTTTYTYAIDCYRHESAEVAQLFNFIRQEFGFTFAFYVVHLGEDIGYQFVFLMFTLLGGVVAFLGMVFIVFRGEYWRKRLGRPEGVNAFDSMLDENALEVNDGTGRHIEQR